MAVFLSDDTPGGRRSASQRGPSASCPAPQFPSSPAPQFPVSCPGRVHHVANCRSDRLRLIEWNPMAALLCNDVTAPRRSPGQRILTRPPLIARQRCGNRDQWQVAVIRIEGYLCSATGDGIDLAAEGLEETWLCPHPLERCPHVLRQLRHRCEHLLVVSLQTAAARHGCYTARRAQRARRHERRHNGGDTQTGSDCAVAAEPRPSRNPRQLRFLWIRPSLRDERDSMSTRPAIKAG